MSRDAARSLIGTVLRRLGLAGVLGLMLSLPALWLDYLNAAVFALNNLGLFCHAPILLSSNPYNNSAAPGSDARWRSAASSGASGAAVSLEPRLGVRGLGVSA